MGFAPVSVCFDIGDGSLLGSFVEKDHKNIFEFSANNDNDPWSAAFPHKIWLNHDETFRYGTVKKTVAYVVIDEDDFGKPVIEKWKIKDHRTYDRSTLRL